MSTTTTAATTALLPFQPDAMTPAQLAAVSYLARYSAHTHQLYAYQLRRWFGWCEANGLDALIGVQRAHVELYLRHLRDRGLRDSSICTMMHGVRGFFRFAHIDGRIPADPAVYVWLPRIQSDETRTQGLDRLELIRFSRSPKPSPCTMARWPTCSVSTPSAPLRPPRCGSRTTPKRSAGTESCTWSARAANPRRSR